MFKKVAAITARIACFPAADLMDGSRTVLAWGRKWIKNVLRALSDCSVENDCAAAAAVVQRLNDWLPFVCGAECWERVTLMMTRWKRGS